MIGADLGLLSNSDVPEVEAVSQGVPEAMILRNNFCLTSHWLLPWTERFSLVFFFGLFVCLSLSLQKFCLMFLIFKQPFFFSPLSPYMEVLRLTSNFFYSCSFLLRWLTQNWTLPSRWEQTTHLCLSILIHLSHSSSLAFTAHRPMVLQNDLVCSDGGCPHWPHS